MGFSQLSDEKLDELIDEYMGLTAALMEEQRKRRTHQGLINPTKNLIETCLNLQFEHVVSDVKKKQDHQE